MYTVPARARRAVPGLLHHQDSRLHLANPARSESCGAEIPRILVQRTLNREETVESTISESL